MSYWYPLCRAAHNGLRAKNAESYQYRGKREKYAWLFHSSIIRRNVRLARDLMRKKFADQKNLARYFCPSPSSSSELCRNTRSECSNARGCCTLSHFISPYPAPSRSSSALSRYSFLCLSFFCSVVPDARCSLRIIKVVANLDWRELRIHSLASARGNWYSQPEKLRRPL